MAGLGVAQIVSWGTLYYSFPLLAEPMATSLGLSKLEIYGAASLGLLSAGVATFPVGRLIDRGHGRRVMALGAVLGAAMLWAWSTLTAPGGLIPLFVGIGVAQAMTFYEPAFAVIARRQGAAGAREGITQLTLWGGFASTVFIPVTQMLLSWTGWRETLLMLAALQFLLAAVPNWLVIEPGGARALRGGLPPARQGSGAIVAWAARQPAFWGLLLAFTLYYGTFSALALHLYPLLMERGLAAAAVVTALALIGPAQVVGRAVLWKLAGHVSMRIVGVITITGLGLGLLLLRFAGTSFAALAAFALIYGAANGVMTIVRGLVVPEMLSREHYGALNGLLAAPALVAKAAAPVLAAWIWTVGGGYALLLDLTLLATVLVLASFIAAAFASARLLVDSPTRQTTIV